MPLPYETVSNMYKTLADAGVVTQPLTQWSQDMNQHTNSREFDAGVHDNFIKRSSLGIDRLIAKTGLDERGANLGRSVGGAFGASEAGARVGHGLARSVVDFAPLLIPGVGQAGIGARLLATAGTGLLSGANTYTATDSPAAGVISGLTAAAMPKVADLAEQAALKYGGGRLVQGLVAGGTKENPLSVLNNVSQRVPQLASSPGTTNMGLLLGSKLAGQGAAAGMMGGAQVAEQAVDPNQKVSNPFNADMALNLTLGQLPFAAMHAMSGHASNAEAVHGMESAIEQTNKMRANRDAEDALRNQTPLEKLPVVDQKESVEGTLDETNKILDGMFNRKRDLAKTPTPDNVEAGKELDKQIVNTINKNGIPDDATLFTKQTSSGEHTPVTGTLHYESKKGNYRIVRVDDNPANGEFAGKLISHSVLLPRGDDPGSPKPTIGEDGKITFQLPLGRTTEVKDSYVNGKPPQPTSTEQPQQGLELTPRVNGEELQPHDPSVFDHVTALNDVQKKAQTATSLEEFESAVVDINNIRARFDIAPLDKKFIEEFVKASKFDNLTDTVTALAADSSRQISQNKRLEELNRQDTQRAIDEKANYEKATQRYNDVLAGGEGHDPAHVKELNDLVNGEDVIHDATGKIYHKPGINDKENFAPVLEQLPIWYQQWEAGTLQNGTAKKPESLQKGPGDNFGLLKKKVQAAFASGAGLKRGESAVGTSVQAKAGLADKVVGMEHSPLTAPLVSKVLDNVIVASAKTPEIETAFNEWQKSTGDQETDFPAEQDRWRLYWNLRAKDELSDGKTLSSDEAATFADASARMHMDVEDPSVLTDFPSRSYVQMWNEQLNKLTEGKGEVEQVPQEQQEHGDVEGWQDQEDGLSEGPLMDFEDYATRALENKGVTSDVVPTQVARAKNIVGEVLKKGATLVQKFTDPVLDFFTGPIQEVGGKIVRLGNTDVAANGWMNEARFLKSSQIPRAVFDALKLAYPEAFRKGAGVNVTELLKGLKERSMVEVKKLGDEGTRQGESRRVQIIGHELDTRFPGWLMRGESQMQPAELALVQERADLVSNGALADGSANTARTKYSFLGPKDEQSMPGYVEGLVRVPLKKAPAKISSWDSVDSSNEHVGAQYVGPHFGSEDNNVLAFFRGYEETLPNGKKAFHLIEVQSDWGQRSRQLKPIVEQRANGKWAAYDRNDNRKDFSTKEEAQKWLADNQGGHPLLAVYETLALKAAIAHAREIGAESVVLSDGETAMMTEGHDKVSTYDIVDERGTVVNSASTRETAEKAQKEFYPNGVVVAKVKQDSGMRLHYDQTLPDNLAKLTGAKGERVELGVHKGAIQPNAGPFDTVTQSYSGLVEGSPAFRNPDGSPKSSITGRAYSLDRMNANLGQNPGLSMKESVQERTPPTTKVAAPTVETLLDNLAQSPTRSPEVQATALRLGEALQPTSEQYPTIKPIMDELGFATTQQGADELLHQGLNGMVANMDAISDIMPEELTKYLYASARDMETVLSTVTSAAHPDNQNLVSVPGQKEILPVVQRAIRAVREFLQIEQEQQQAKDTVREVANTLPPDAYMNSVMDDPKKVMDIIGESTTPEALGAMKYSMMQMGQLAKSDPVTAEVIAKGFQLGPNTHAMASTSKSPFGIDLKNPQFTTKEGLKLVQNLLENKKLLKAVNSWVYENQAKNPDAVTKLPADHPNVAQHLRGLTPDQVRQASEAVTKLGMSTKIHQEQILEKVNQISILDLAHIPMADQKMKFTDAIKLTTQFMDVLKMDTSISEAAQIAQANLNVIAHQMTPEAFLELLKRGQNETEKYSLYKEHFDKNTNWVTAQRLERYLVNGKKNGKAWSNQASSIKEADAIAKEHGITDYAPKDQWKDHEDDAVQLGDVPPAVFARLQQLEDNRIEWLKKSGATAEEIAQEQKVSSVSQFFRESAAQGGAPGFVVPPRNLSKGAQDLPYFWNHIAYLDKSSSYWTRQVYRAQARGHLMDPEIAANPILQKQLQQQTANLLRADPKLISTINKAVSVWYMAFQPATALVDGAASLLRHSAEFVSMGVGPLKAYLNVVRAHGIVTDQAISGKGWINPEHGRLMENARKAMEIDQDWTHGEFGDQEGLDLNLKRSLMKGKVQTTGQRLGTLAGVYTKTGMWMVRQSNRFVEQSALLASFDHYRGQGLTFDESQAKAFEFNHAVNPVGGKAQRAIGLYSGKDQFSRGFAALAGNMQSYNWGTMGQLARYIQGGRGRQEGLTPAEQWNHSKAAVQMLGTQAALAGILGLPGASGALALLDKVFPGLEVNKRLREWMSKLFSQDAENGNPIADMAMTGLPSMLGWDMSSRLSFGNVVPGVSEINGFQPELLLGPPASLLTKFMGGAQKVLTGQPVGAEAFLPKTVRTVFDMVKNNGNEEDYKGRMLYQLTPGEGIGKLLGFQSKRTSDANAAARMASQSDMLQSQRRRQWNNQQAEDALRGNFGNVRNELKTKKQDNPDFDLKSSVDAMARAAEEQSFPRDLRSEGTIATSPEHRMLMDAFGVQANAVSEVARWQFRQQFKQRLGIMTDSSEGLIQARLMDQLSVSNPSLTRAELRRMAMAKLHGPQIAQTVPETF